MELKNQVCSLELSKQLKKLGVRQNSLFYYLLPNLKEYTITGEEDLEKIGDYYLGQAKEIGVAWCKEDYSAFTVAELGEILPNDITFVKTAMPEGFICIFKTKQEEHREYDFLINQQQNEADARAKMLIYLIEKKLTSPNKQNE